MKGSGRTARSHGFLFKSAACSCVGTDVLTWAAAMIDNVSKMGLIYQHSDFNVYV